MRKFFTQNKIYFEIFSLLVLGVGGTIITYFQYKVSNQALLIQQSQALPLLRLNVEKLQNFNNSFFDTEVLNVYNEGELIKDINCTTTSFIRLRINKSASNYKSSIIYLPLAEYLNTKTITSQHKGKLMELYSFGNYKSFYNNIYIKAIQNSNNNLTISAERITLVNLTYRDIINTHHTEYYYVTSESQLIDRTKYLKVMQASRKYFNKKYSISEVDFSRLLRIAKTAHDSVDVI